MDLILWRHAEAQEESEAIPDLQRDLTAKGKKQASRMASWLDRKLPEGTRILVSPAQRTEQTAQALSRKYKVCPELGPQGKVAELLELIKWPDAKYPVLVIGHQPTLGQLIANLLDLKTSECAVKKGGVWWLRYRERQGQSETLLVTVQSPETV